MKTGVISDTHGLLRPEALDALAGCELIVHAGDIGKPEIIEVLQALAPVQVVRGNNDLKLPWAVRLADQRRFDMEGWQTLLVHDIADVPAELDEAVRVVITGHSHKPLIDWRQGRLFLNPGSAGPRRFKLPVTVAVIDIEGEHLAPRIIQLLE
ncbi:MULTISPECIES: metallophosphoesterase family protein [Pseudomonas]|uniref:metallophosphoesterase family protein n=1 Tax=Pseudomonas TaxID=286 RepID=UPI0020C2F581|nr:MULTISPECIES: metallophosphoesterase family protein [Pseudomonas]MDH1574631.1 metallophosphatase family protein [Pseudomonas sp. GD03746]UTL83127.1 metallophosphatase family protein [Pseudomonas putida]